MNGIIGDIADVTITIGVYSEFRYDKKLTHLILVAKHRCLKIANNKVIVKWNCHNYYTQTILLAQFTVKLLQQTNSAADLIEKYIDFLLQCNILIM